MRVILKEKIANLGDVGELVTVKAGYARNYLIPFEKAAVANTENIAEFEKHRAELQKKAAEILALTQSRADKLKDFEIQITVEASEEGKLFGSVGPRDIAMAVSEAGHELAKSEVLMPEGPIRQIGDYDISLQLHSEVHATIKVKVVATS